MKRNLIITAILAFLIVLAGAFTFAQRQKENRRDNIHENMVEKLNLTDEQQSQIEEIRFNHQEKVIDLKADVKKKELALKELQSTNDFSRSDYIANIEQIISAQNKIKLANANHRMDVYELLDTEQQETWNKMNKMKYRKQDKLKKHFRRNKHF